MITSESLSSLGASTHSQGDRPTNSRSTLRFSDAFVGSRITWSVYIIDSFRNYVCGAAGIIRAPDMECKNYPSCQGGIVSSYYLRVLLNSTGRRAFASVAAQPRCVGKSGGTSNHP